ncbi:MULTISPECIES: chromate transporter [unclassified Bosea (in: a-proteobacteria)]|uniref:chromate transporter n=1 Tax=unclassified Bosea (in: a-proteobacteria) TaxID=2653178 RepID=UPI000955A17A|nr:MULTISPECIES: chromate transporter [unclassified Bosea (in: a-proteobacteria)]TAJ27769.1 MAG: chromate transporter [Bosea sp. (in: a-proteobacteria)]SIQ10427.1 chromate transporter [Bosea sp. TND4EK4]
MQRGVFTQLAVTFGTISLMAIGGANAVVPEIHRQVVDLLAWMDAPTFARLFAIAQTAPGPNVMLASIIGWQVAGTPGLLVATLAMLVPSSLLALACGRGLRRWSDNGAVRIVTLALVPIALGLMLASGAVATLAADAGLFGYAITAATALVTYRSKVNPLVPMAVGTAGYVLVWLAGLA